MPTRNMIDAENDILRRIKAKQPVQTLRKVLVDENKVLLEFANGAPNDQIYLIVDWPSFTILEIHLPRIFFPRFQGTYLVSNFKNAKMIEMFQVLSIVNNAKFIKDVAAILEKAKTQPVSPTNQHT